MREWNVKIIVAGFAGRETAAIADQGLVSAVNFLTNILIARFLGLEQFGVFALAWMAVLFFNSIQLALIISPMMSIGQKHDHQARRFYYGAVAAQASALAVISAVLVALGVNFSGLIIPQWRISDLALPLGCVTLTSLLQDFIRRYYFSTGRAKLALLNDIFSYLPQLPGLWLLHSREHLSATSALWCISGTSLIGVVVGLPSLWEIQLRVSAVLVATRRNWQFAKWLIPSALMQWTSGNLFIVCAPIFYGAAAAGILRAAQNIVGVTHIWFLGLDNVVPAEAAKRVHEGGVTALSSYLGKVTLRWGLLTLLFLGSFSLAPNFWLKLVYGDALVGHGDILQLYALLYALVFLGGPLRAGLQALEFTKPIFWAYLAMTIFALICAVPFAKVLGLKGAMFGTIITQIIFQSSLGVALVRRVKDIDRTKCLATSTI